MGILHLMVLCVIMLCRPCFFFLQIEGLWQFCIEQSYQCHFSNSICSLPASVLHLGNSHISNVFIIITFVMMVCDQ